METTETREALEVLTAAEGRMSDEKFVAHVRELGGVREALIAQVNPWLLQHGPLRDEWVSLQLLWEQLNTCVQDVDETLDALVTPETWRA